MTAILGVFLLAVLVNGDHPSGDVSAGARIDAAMAAAQSLQGRLDGGWTLRDGSGRPLFRFEFADPAGGQGPLTGAWRDLGGGPHGAAGMLADVRRSGRSLRIDFTPGDGPAATLQLMKNSAGAWTGRMIAGAKSRAVVLRRDAVATSGPE